MATHGYGTVDLEICIRCHPNAGRETPSRSDDPAPRSDTPSTGGTPLEAHRQEKSMS
jgi:hypothetical protein